MSPSFASAEHCLETSGFLFSHACERGASTQCSRCQKPVCALHTRMLDDGEVCVSCARTADNGDENRDGSETDWDEDDPSYYYDGYGYYGRGAWTASGTSHDRNDFTEADGESLRREDDASFEEDLGGS
ncbi:hypothetical protein [Corallococcus terminator]|uniref:Uncharacterized protein n=1 Tax=Corallococcus terminator TaxID=2316733 RepID=A0A3A8IEN0_9BACT|nr:hypothetical protein [Corallococcus terminator]RKG81937.1 hypothetical protein D7V88_25875 [Corallococcus terminator]